MYSSDNSYSSSLGKAITIDEVIHEISTWRSDISTPLHGHTGPVRAVTITTNNVHVLSGSEDKTIIIWLANTQENINTLKGHLHTISFLEFQKMTNA